MSEWTKDMQRALGTCLKAFAGWPDEERKWEAVAQLVSKHHEVVTVAECKAEATAKGWS